MNAFRQIQRQRLKTSVNRVTTKFVFINKFFRKMVYTIVHVVTSAQGKRDQHYLYQLQLELLAILSPYKAHLIAFLAFVETHFPKQLINNIFEELLPFESPSPNLTNLNQLTSLLNSLFYNFKQGKVDLEPDVFLLPIFDDMARRNIPEQYCDLIRESISAFRVPSSMDTYCDAYLKLVLSGLRYHPDMGADIRIWQPLMPLFQLLRELLPELIDPRRVLTEEKFQRILGGIRN